VGSKTRGEKDRQFLREALPDFEFLGFIDYDDEIISCDMRDVCPADSAEQAKKEATAMAQRLVEIAEKET
jgi:CO dehydrogenase maturation factor